MTKLRKAWVEAAGLNYGANLMNAPIKAQQRYYRRYLTIPEDRREEATDAGIAWWKRRFVKGPGVDW